MVEIERERESETLKVKTRLPRPDVQPKACSLAAKEVAPQGHSQTQFLVSSAVVISMLFRRQQCKTKSEGCVFLKLAGGEQGKHLPFQGLRERWDRERGREREKDREGERERERYRARERERGRHGGRDGKISHISALIVHVIQAALPR